MQEKEIYKVITADEVKMLDDIYKINQPIFWAIDIYNSHKEYLQSAKRFTLEQRYLNAIFWYFAEVNNGGHIQFFTNATGIVWQDVIDGLNHFGIKSHAKNFQKVLDYFNETIPFDRDEREKLFDSADDELDEILKNIESDFKNADKEILNFIKNNPDKFTFNGTYRSYQAW